MERRAVTFFSDIHCGAASGLLHPDGVRDDRGILHKPDETIQPWLWSRLELFLDDVNEVTKGYSNHVMVNGDVIEGIHHGTEEIISNDVGVHCEAAANVLDYVLSRLNHRTVHFVAGTPAHVGQGYRYEKVVTHKLRERGHRERIQLHQASNTYVWPYVYARMKGHPELFDIRHHGRTGKREHTRGPQARWYAQDIWQTHVNEGRTPPDIAIRSHLHKFIDSGADHRGLTREDLEVLLVNERSASGGNHQPGPLRKGFA